MIAKDLRFHGHGSLKYVYSKGRQERLKQASIRFATNKRNKKPRIAVVVSKKVTKLAPKRNRIRRRFYESLRHNLPNFNDTYDLVITVFDENLADCPHQEIENITKTLLSKSQIIAVDKTDMV